MVGSAQQAALNSDTHEAGQRRLPRTRQSLRVMRTCVCVCICVRACL